MVLKIPEGQKYNTTVNKFMSPYILTIHPVTAVASTIALGFVTLIALSKMEAKSAIVETLPDGTVKIIGPKGGLENIASQFNKTYQGFSTSTQVNIFFVITLIVAVIAFYLLVLKK